MAVFTTEVRTICESIAGIQHHVSFGDIDRAIASSWEEIFQPTWNTFDPDYKVILCTKILKHYWMREIGCETVGLWLHYLNTRLGEVIPYYNKLYESAAMEFDPLHDYDMTHTSQRNEDGVTDSQNSGESTDTVNSTDNSTHTRNGEEKVVGQGSSTGQSINKFSDTPQGSLDGVLTGEYLTNASVDANTGSQNSQRDSTNKDNSTGEIKRNERRTNENSSTGKITAKTTEEYVLTMKGKTGSKSYSKLLMEYRDSLINIDKLIIDGLSDLFMGLWA